MHMRTMLWTGLVALGLVGQAAADNPPSVDGKWQIVYAESGGRRNNSWEQRQATVQDNVLKYEASDGKEHAITLKLEPHQMLEASESGGETHKGVYVVGQDYFVISLGTGSFGNGAGAAAATPRASAAGKGESSGSFILILRRQRSGGLGGEK
jgi:hypothetical protein